MVELGEAVPMLERTPAVVRSLLADVPEQWSAFRPATDAWSARDVVGHLIHGERTDWIPRIRWTLDHGASRPFPPFDREGMRDDPAGPAELVDMFEALRSTGLRDLGELTLGVADLGRIGRHPDLGDVTVSQLIATWVAHDLSHVAQIAETLAKRYREEVGPWRAYLPTLDRPELRD